MYLLSMIIVAAVLIFGIHSFTSVSDQIDSAEFSDFKNTLKTKLIQLRSSYQEVENLDLRIPRGITRLCFADLSLTGKGLEDDIDDPVAVDTVMSGAANVLIYSGNDIVEPMFVEGISVHGDYICLDKRGGVFSFSLKGVKDDRVLVSSLE